MNVTLSLFIVFSGGKNKWDFCIENALNLIHEFLYENFKKKF